MGELKRIAPRRAAHQDSTSAAVIPALVKQYIAGLKGEEVREKLHASEPRSRNHFRAIQQDQDEM